MVNNIYTLLEKDNKLQLRKKKTNYIVFGFVCCILFILVVIQNVCVIDPSTSYGELTSSCNTRFNETVYKTCSDWFNVAFKDAPAPSDPAGALYSYNTTNSNSGLLGNIPQGFYQYENSLNYTAFTPFFTPVSNPVSYIDSLYKNISQQQQGYLHDGNVDCYDVELNRLLNSFPDGVVLFQELSYKKRVLDYLLMVRHHYLDWLCFSYSVDYRDNAQILMTMINNAYMKTQGINMTVRSYSLAMPYYNQEPYSSNELIVGLIIIYFIPFTLALLLPLQLYAIVSEKHERLLELTRMMGVRTYEYWIATYLSGIIKYFLIATLTLVVLFAGGVTVNHSNPLVSIILFVLFGFAQVSQAMCISTFFWKPIPALASADVPVVILILLPSVSCVRAWHFLSADMIAGIGGYIESSNVRSLRHYYGMGETYVYLVIATFLYIIVGVYFDKVLPREHGVNKSPFFPIKYLLEKYRNKSPEQLPLLAIKEEAVDELVSDDCEKERIRINSSRAEMLVKVVSLSKKYDKTDKFALSDFSLGIEEGECVGLLGPNGAGKTTLISVLCGLTKPTAGEAFVLGHSIIHELPKVRRLLGFCPQHDILWPDLTVEEHLLFYCNLKSHGGDIAYLHVQKLAQEVGLSGEFLHRQVSKLSGGLKRRLSIGIALVGSSRVVILDEPTAGLDHTARRAVWDIIERQKKAGRSFIITTHDMAEADVLCSRIAIVSQGRLYKIGEPTYLKSLFGSGYNLKLHIDINHPTENIQHFLGKIMPQAILSKTTTDTYEFTIPDPQANLRGIVAELMNSSDIGIVSWSIHPTSLQQVFLQLIHEDESKDK